MFIKRQGVPHFLASFNLGSHLPQTLKTWSPCEVEAYFLNKGIEKAEFFVKQTECPGIVLTDNKPVYQAKLNLDKDKFSSSLRLQNLLTNLSAKRFIIQLLSAQLPSPILTLVDFASRHPVEFDSSSCTVCKDNTLPRPPPALQLLLSLWLPPHLPSSPFCPLPPGKRFVDKAI